MVQLKLKNFSVSGVANHGIHISDCSLADACGAGSGGTGDGSQVSVSVTLDHVTVFDVGNGTFDADGLRVDERGEDSIYLNANYLIANHVVQMALNSMKVTKVVSTPLCDTATSV